MSAGPEPERLLERALLGCLRLGFMVELREQAALNSRYAARLQSEMLEEIKALETALTQLQETLGSSGVATTGAGCRMPEA